MTTKPGAGDGAALEGPLDPELPGAAYVLDPRVLAPLRGRIVTSNTSGEHRPPQPFTGEPLGAFPWSAPGDVTTAVQRARRAQPDWAATPVAERCAVLLRFSALILERQSEVLDLIQHENGKARLHAFEEVADVAQLSRHYGTRGPRYLAPQSVRGMLPLLTQTRVFRRPLGVVGVISPWNYPLTLALSEVVPALVAGNAVVLRPDPQTTFTALWAAALFAEAGLPEDLLLIVTGGPDVGARLVEEVNHIAFTGSTTVGRRIAAQAGRRLIPATLELGGKNPTYIAADVHIPTAARGCVRACFASTGQLCVSTERLILHESIADAFLARFIEQVRQMRIGATLDYSSDMGSLTSAAQLERVTRQVEDARARGARVLTGGVRLPEVGPLFYAPTVLANVPDAAVCFTEETFGPVVVVSTVQDDDAAIAAMNNSQYGLNAAIWTQDIDRGRRLAGRVEAGSVNINDGYSASFGSLAAPMGGFKASGLGRRHGAASIDAMTQLQTVAVQRGVRYGLSLDALNGLGGDRSAAVLTAALNVMRRLRMQ